MILGGLGWFGVFPGASNFYFFMAVVAGPAGPASAGPLFWPNILSAVSLFLPFQPLLSCLPVI